MVAAVWGGTTRQSRLVLFGAGTATEYEGKMALADGAATIAAVTVLGPQLDAWGRKPLFIPSLVTNLTGVGPVLIAVANRFATTLPVLASASVMNASSKPGVTFASVTVVSTLDVAVPAVRAAVADMSRSTI